MDIGIGISNKLHDMNGPTLIDGPGVRRPGASPASLDRPRRLADEIAAFADAAGLPGVAAGSSPPVELKAELTALAIGRSRGSGGDRPCG